MPTDPRQLYLDLLKKALTDYLHVESDYANAMPPEFWWPKSWLKELRNRLLAGYLRRAHMLVLRHDRLSVAERRARREKGLDWPFNADTMIGLKRLDNLQTLIETVLKDKIAGDLIETGVWRGGAAIFMRAVLKAHDVTDRLVWACDSFEGLPPPEPDKYPADAGDPHHTFRFLAVSQEQVERNFERYGLLDNQVRFVKGFFQDTLARVPAKTFALLRLDGDMYASTIVALDALHDRLSPGGFIVIDDYHLKSCRQAVHDFRDRRGIADEIVDIDGQGAYWRKTAHQVGIVAGRIDRGRAVPHNRAMADSAPFETRNICRICGAAAAATYVVREMMFGLRDVFEYFQCGDCGCLQIADVPSDLGRYYPNNYYSFNPGRKRVRPLRRFLRAVRARFAIERKGLLGRILFWQKKPDPLLVLYGDLGVKLTDRLLDVGGGGGGHVWQLREAGVTRALAIDTFIDQDVTIDGIPLARKTDVFGIEGEFDIITFHHSFEHMDRQRDTLARCRALLAPGGRVLIRVPTVTSEAWEHYRENWVGVDAPRHLYLHSHESLRRLAAAVGFRVERLWCDSEILQFWGSEQYHRDIPLDSDRSFGRGLAKSIFTAEQIADFRRRAAQLNTEMRGDAICALMVPDGAGV